MKKVMLSLVTIFLIFSSFLFLDKFSTDEILNIIEGNGTDITIKSEENPEEIISAINSASKKFNVSIEKVEYMPPTSNTQFETVQIYTSKYYNDTISRFNSIDMKPDNFIITNSFMSNRASKNNLQVGTINIIKSDLNLEVRKLEDAKNINFQTPFKIASKNQNTIEGVIAYLEQENINVSLNTLSGQTYSINFQLVLLIACLYILVTLAMFYKCILSFKEFGIKKLNGYSNKTIQIEITKEFAKMLFFPELILFTIMMILSFIFYKGLSIHLIFSYFIALIVVEFILSLTFYFVSYIVKIVSISEAIKNKKPVREMQIANYITKIFLTVIIISIGTTTIISLQSLMKTKQSLEFWDSSKNYAFTYLNNITEGENKNLYEYGKKSQYFYELVEKKGAILFLPSPYYLVKDSGSKLTQDGNFRPYLEEYISINSNYLEQFPILDTYGTPIKVSNAKNTQFVLIPEKYLAIQNEIESSFKSDYESLRFYDENLYNESKGLPLVNEEVSTEFIYIQNNQEFFSFDPQINKDNNNFIKDPIFVIYTPTNQGTDKYLSLLSNSGLFIEVKNLKNPFIDVSPFIKEAGLEKNILTTPILYSRYSKNIYDLNQNLLKYSTLFFASFFVSVILICFMSLNYLEKNKYEIALKRIHGYSFYSIHWVYLLNPLVINFFAGFIIAFVTRQFVIPMMLICFLIVVESTIEISVLLLNQNRNIRNTLKGE